MNARDYYDCARGITWKDYYEVERLEKEALQKEYEALQKKYDELYRMKSPFEYALESTLPTALEPVTKALKGLATQTASNTYNTYLLGRRIKGCRRK